MPNIIPPQYRECKFWTYCIHLEYAKKIKIIQFLKGKLPRGSYDIEDIVMMSTIQRDNAVIKMVLRMNFASRQYKILKLTDRKRRKLNNVRIPLRNINVNYVMNI